jgi:hypothetical protein
VAADLYSIGHEASFSKSQASKSQALGASSGVDCRRGPGAWVLALGVLAKLDATIQLFHTSHWCRSRSGAAAAGKGHIIKEFN